MGTWAKVARAHGLRFGVSHHDTPGRVWDEFMPVRYKSDATGPLSGVPYNGVQTIADGKGKWWDGLAPQMLNGKPHWKNTPCPEFTREFLLRVEDVIDRYDPDLLYFDDNAQFDFDAGGKWAPDLGVWLGIPDLAPQIMAYYYNVLGFPDLLGKREREQEDHPGLLNRNRHAESSLCACLLSASIDSLQLGGSPARAVHY